MKLSKLVASARAQDGALDIEISSDWLQGRTTYGGLSTALAYAAATRGRELPPLRSALVAFIGPTGTRVKATTSVLRQGRSVTFIESDLRCENELATRCVFAFGGDRTSALADDYLEIPQVSPPDACEPYLTFEGHPSFTRNFEVRLAAGGRPGTASPHASHMLWVRHRDEAASGTLALLALADMPPPAILPKLDKMAPASSMTWMLNVLRKEPHERGWYLVKTCAENARHGYSSQDMSVWNEALQPVIAARQSVAVFA